MEYLDTAPYLDRLSVTGPSHEYDQNNRRFTGLVTGGYTYGMNATRVLITFATNSDSNTGKGFLLRYEMLGKYVVILLPLQSHISQI